jgi:hypothetical protein
MTSILNLFFSSPKAHSTFFLKVICFPKKNQCFFYCGRDTPFINTGYEGYILGDVVSHGMLIPVNSEGECHFRSVFYYDINKYDHHLFHDARQSHDNPIHNDIN